MVCVVVSTLAFRAGDRGSIPPMDQQIFNFPFSPSHPSGVTKPSSLKLATSGITHPSDAQRGVISRIKWLPYKLLPIITGPYIE